MAVNITDRTTPHLVSLATVRETLVLPAADTTHDDILEVMIGAASERFRRECGQPIVSTSTVWTTRGTGTTRLTLPYRPVSSITSVEYESGLDTWVTITASDYALRNNDTSLYWLDRVGAFSRSVTYRVTMLAGASSIPWEVEAVVLNAVVLDWRESPFSENRLGVDAKTITNTANGIASTTLHYNRAEFERNWARVVA